MDDSAAATPAPSPSEWLAPRRARRDAGEERIALAELAERLSRAAG